MELGESVDGMGRPAHSMLMKLYISVPLVPAGAMSQLTEYPHERDSRKTICCLQMYYGSPETTWVNWEEQVWMLSNIISASKLKECNLHSGRWQVAIPVCYKTLSISCMPSLQL